MGGKSHAFLGEEHNARREQDADVSCFATDYEENNFHVVSLSEKLVTGRSLYTLYTTHLLQQDELRCWPCSSHGHWRWGFWSKGPYKLRSRYNSVDMHSHGPSTEGHFITSMK